MAYMEELMPLIREALSNGASVRIRPRGTSMLPMLREETDSVVLSPVDVPLKKYDLPLYCRDNGKYVLHRIIEAGETYTCMGDNQFQPERGIRRDQMIAVVTAFYRGDRKIDVASSRYRLYCWLWDKTRYLRYQYRRGLRWLRRHMG